MNAELVHPRWKMGKCGRRLCWLTLAGSVLAASVLLTAGIGLNITFRRNLDGALQLAESDDEATRTNAATVLFQTGDRAIAGLQQIVERGGVAGANARVFLDKLQNRAAPR